MSSVDHESLPVEDDGRFYQDTDKLLKLAEELDERCYKQERQIGLTAFTIVLVFLTLLTAGVATWYWSGLERVGSVVAGSLALAYAIACAWFSWISRTRAIDKLRRDRRALYEIVGMLREIATAMAKMNNLSAIEQAEFRIRLARFNIGPESYRGY